MITVLENNKEFNYQIWNSDVITNHFDEIIDALDTVITISLLDK